MPKSEPRGTLWAKPGDLTHSPDFLKETRMTFPLLQSCPALAAVLSALDAVLCFYGNGSFTAHVAVQLKTRFPTSLAATVARAVTYGPA